MSRHMEYACNPSLDVNSAWVALECPAGHKYEILEVIVDLGDTGGRTVVPIVRAASNYYQADTTVGGGAYEPVRFSYNALVLQTGDQFLVYVAGDGSGPWAGYVTFIDVEF